MAGTAPAAIYHKFKYINIMWIAKEKSGILKLYSSKPEKAENGTWSIDNGYIGIINQNDISCFDNLGWDGDLVEVRLTSQLVIQAFGDACYDCGYTDANLNEYGKESEGNLWIGDFFEHK